MKRKHFVLFFPLLSLMIVLACSCKGQGANTQGAQNADAGAAMSVQPHDPMVYTYKVNNVYPHDVDSYTQGLYWHDGYLWEGTGEYGNSKLRKVDLETGEAVQEIALADKYFGEGITLLNGLIYQLTWREGEAFVYDAGSFERVGSFKYPGEGWALTTDGEKLYMSDGTNKIRVLDPKDFKVLSTIEVRDGRQPVRMLNELEWVDGEIWANIYLTDEVVVINTVTGEVTGRIDFAGLLPRAERMPYTDVLNGIAYDAKTGRFFVTGKKWHKLFEVEFVEK